MADHTKTVDALLAQGGQTFSAEAGFTLKDTPSPLWELVVLCILLAKPISAPMAVDACAELRRIGLRTPQGTLDTTWQQCVDALGRAHYRRFDESSATRMSQAATFVLDRYAGDLRGLAQASGQDPHRAAELLTEVPGIGPAGADIFLREAQAVWPWLQPYLDHRVLDGAHEVGLPHTHAGLTTVFQGQDAAALAAALVRVTIDDELATAVRAAGTG